MNDNAFLLLIAKKEYVVVCSDYEKFRQGCSCITSDLNSFFSTFACADLAEKRGKLCRYICCLEKEIGKGA